MYYKYIHTVWYIHTCTLKISLAFTGQCQWRMRCEWPNDCGPEMGKLCDITPMQVWIRIATKWEQMCCLTSQMDWVRVCAAICNHPSSWTCCRSVASMKASYLWGLMASKMVKPSSMGSLSFLIEETAFLRRLGYKARMTTAKKGALLGMMFFWSTCNVIDSSVSAYHYLTAALVA